METSTARLAAEFPGNSNSSVIRIRLEEFSNSSGRINDLGKRVKNARELSGTEDDAAL